jgi:hypothetical protein
MRNLICVHHGHQLNFVIDVGCSVVFYIRGPEAFYEPEPLPMLSLDTNIGTS